MSEVSKWITSLGKAFTQYDGLFEENGVSTLDLLGLLAEEEMVTELGVKKLHARMIYHGYKRDFVNANTKNLKPSVVKITEKSKSVIAFVKDDKKTDSKITDAYNLDVKALAGIFPQDKMWEKLLRYANQEDSMAKALSLLQLEIAYLSRIQKQRPPIKHRGFLSHVQQNSADLCRSLFYGLKEKQTSVWLDMSAGRLDARGMADGIATSSYFVIIATKCYFSRPWTVYELLIAQVLCKPIIVAVEADRRHGGMTFDEFLKLIPKPWEFLKAHEIMKIERRGDFWVATVNELNKRLNEDTKDERKAKDEALRNDNDGNRQKPRAAQKKNVNQNVSPDMEKIKRENDAEVQRLVAGANKALMDYEIERSLKKINDLKMHVEQDRQRTYQRRVNDWEKKVEQERQRATLASLQNKFKQTQFDGAMGILRGI